MQFRETASFTVMAITLALGGAPALAQESAAPAQEAGDIIVTGTRVTGLRAADSPAPIQLLSAADLSRTGQPDLVQALAQNLPSVQAQAFGSDLQAHNLQM